MVARSLGSPLPPRTPCSAVRIQGLEQILWAGGMQYPRSGARKSPEFRPVRLNSLQIGTGSFSRKQRTVRQTGTCGRFQFRVRFGNWCRSPMEVPLAASRADVGLRIGPDAEPTMIDAKRQRRDAGAQHRVAHDVRRILAVRHHYGQPGAAHQARWLSQDVPPPALPDRPEFQTVGQDDDWSRVARIAKRPVGDHTRPRRSCAPTSSFAYILLEALPPIAPRQQSVRHRHLRRHPGSSRRAGTPERALDQDRNGLGLPLPGRASPRPLLSEPHRLVSALAYNHGPDHWRFPYNQHAVLWPSALSKRYPRVIAPSIALAVAGVAFRKG